jgi:hypothetical protein
MGDNPLSGLIAGDEWAGLIREGRLGRHIQEGVR